MHDRRRLRGLLTLAFATLLVTTIGSAQANAGLDRYIVQLSDKPLASYRGGVVGLAPTNPAARGEVKLNPASAASRAYLDYLAGKQTAFLTAAAQALGRPLDVLARYRAAFNGLGVTLASGEAAKIAALPGVREVEPEFTRQLQTDAGPAWIGAPSVWSGNAGGAATKGEGIVVGVIDTGVNHDHPSFADVGGDGYNHTNPRGTFYGLCDPVLGLPFCNDKLIGVWDFTGTTPQDDNGHGSHTASTAAGNVLSAEIQAPTLTVTRGISGVAPHANLITYKACDAASGGCRGISLTLAIDQATLDGVDVINYSIGGGSTDPWDDADSEAFLGARDAGIFVAAAAGNDGPGPETVGSPANAPWLLSVGASTHNRKFANAVTGMSGGGSAPPSDIQGKSFTSGYGPAPIVYAGDYGSALCGEGPAAPTGEAAINPFLPGTFNGEIVVCDRGTYGRVEKAANVKEAGAGGFVLANDAPNGNSLVGDPYPLPGVHIGYVEGVVLKNWLAAGSGHTGSIAGTVVDTALANGDVMASFSSRGPDKTSPNVLKPDVTAPGVDVLAAFNTLGNTSSPPLSTEYGIISGTSMSSPHAAGAAALVRALRPGWTPAEVQSAMMTTALSTGVRNHDGKAATPFAMGAGRLDLTRAARAGVVLDETVPRYQAASSATASTLNVASLANSDCRGTCSWTRVVESTLASSATWAAKTAAPRGVRLTVQPSRFTLAPGATQTITVTADVVNAPVGQWSFAGLTLSSKDAPDARLPIAVFAGGTPRLVEIATTGTTGFHAVTGLTADFELSRFSSVVSGLARGIVVREQLPQDPTSGGIPGAGTGLIGILTPYEAVAGTFSETIEVPQGARFLTAEITASTAPDVDLFIGRDLDGDGPEETEEVCRSTSPSWPEKCTLKGPEAGTWWILVQNWASSPALVDDVELTASVIPNTDNGNLTVTGPSGKVPAGQPFAVTLGWNEPELAVGDYWFGLVEYGSDSKHPNNAGSLLVRLNRTG